MPERDGPRFPVTVPVTLHYDGKVVTTATANISRAGLLLVGPELPPVGCRLKMQITLNANIELECLVCHLVHGCGVRVISMPPLDLERWNAYLDRLATLVAQGTPEPA
jgi:hypothetical protein